MTRDFSLSKISENQAWRVRVSKKPELFLLPPVPNAITSTCDCMFKIKYLTYTCPRYIKNAFHLGVSITVCRDNMLF